MFSDRFFQIALVISLIAHSAMFFKLPQINLLPLRRTLDQIEVTYIKEEATSSSSKLYNKTSPLESRSPKTSSKNIAPPPYVKKEQIFNKVKNIPIEKPELLRPEIIAVKKNISLPEVHDEKMKNPVYLNYYQKIREKIKRAAYQNYTRLVNGEVYLSFIILSNGKLGNIRIDEEKSTTYTYLKEIARKSIYDASPFPDFPKDLNYSELSFNVIISFEVE
jgi:outer membrane biosynthesis protein TonB